MHHAAPERCGSLILADTFAGHPDGTAIYERSVAASSDMWALAEGRVDVLLAQPADPAVREEVVETMARIDPAAFRIGAEAVWLADQADRAAAIRAPTLILCGTKDKVTPPELSRELAQSSRARGMKQSSAPGISPISSGRTPSTGLLKSSSAGSTDPLALAGFPLVRR